MPESGAGFLLAFIGLVVVVLLVLLQLTRLGYLIRATIPDRPRQRMFIASFAFLVTFAGVRLLVHRIAHHEIRMQWVGVRRLADSPRAVASSAYSSSITAAYLVMRPRRLIFMDGVSSPASCVHSFA